ncbi:DNA-binding MarR family transcriptional regulator [Modestobacter versicolor]|uniref:DNA-binding MarR family transcriptional regulator n=2 Tax=Modestobacter versicolor TaxID=429133 RepID=A0A839Y2U2_9ACTN|nr:DNA-binding MarR family transcriptional regulator [Modestobacter versicolor]
MTSTRTPSLTTRDVYDVAQLTGGLHRVVDTAVVVLLQRGRLTADGLGRLQAVGTAVHPAEAAVLALAGPRPLRSVSSIRARAQEDPRLAGIVDRLVADGLLRRNPVAGLSRRWPVHLRTAAGNRVLAEWRAAAPAGSGTAVALGGVAAADPAVRAVVFPGPVPSRVRRPVRRDGALVVDTGGGWGASWGGHGGGGGGFDGGGCGGGDGGGGGGGC